MTKSLLSLHPRGIATLAGAALNALHERREIAESAKDAGLPASPGLHVAHSPNLGSASSLFRRALVDEFFHNPHAVLVASDPDTSTQAGDMREGDLLVAFQDHSVLLGRCRWRREPGSRSSTLELLSFVPEVFRLARTAPSRLLPPEAQARRGIQMENPQASKTRAFLRLGASSGRDLPSDSRGLLLTTRWIDIAVPLKGSSSSADAVDPGDAVHAGYRLLRALREEMREAGALLAAQRPILPGDGGAPGATWPRALAWKSWRDEDQGAIVQRLGDVAGVIHARVESHAPGRSSMVILYLHAATEDGTPARIKLSVSGDVSDLSASWAAAHPDERSLEDQATQLFFSGGWDPDLFQGRKIGWSVPPGARTRARPQLAAPGVMGRSTAAPSHHGAIRLLAGLARQQCPIKPVTTREGILPTIPAEAEDAQEMLAFEALSR